MQDEPSCAATRSDRLQRVILDLLLTDRSPGLWTIDEVGLAVGDSLAAGDAIAELHAFGLGAGRSQVQILSPRSKEALQMTMFAPLH